MPSLAPTFVLRELPTQLPPGYVAATVSGTEGTLRIGTICRLDSKTGAMTLVQLRETIDARVFLACVIDASGMLHKWLELWVQDVSGVVTTPATYREAVNNAALDAKWVQRAQAQAALPGSGVIHSGFERTHSDPLFVDPGTRLVVPAREAKTGMRWALCKDEALLAKKGLPTYAATLSRHLYQPDLGERSELLPVEMLVGEPRAMASALGIAADSIPLNPGGGMMMVVPLAPLTYEHVVDAITGAASEAGDADPLLRSIAASALGAGEGRSNALASRANGWLSLVSVTARGRLAEALHLKLMLLAGAITQVRDATAAVQSPMLNLGAESFRISLAAPSPALPLWWTARVSLVTPGEAAPVTIAGASEQYFIPARSGGLSVYAPAIMSAPMSGRGWLVLRNINTEAGGAILEGTLRTQERLTTHANDLIWLRVPVGGARIDLHATADQSGPAIPGQIRLRTLATRLPEPTLAALKAGLGVNIPDVSFEKIEAISTPCDLYALGVLAVRTLLVDGRWNLPVAMDEVLSLAMQASAMRESGLDLADRIGQVLESDSRVLEALGPHRLLADATSAKEAMAAIPPRLWASTLAFAIRMLTGLSPDSRCATLGEAPAGAIHRVFDGPLEEVFSLLGACRALIVPDFALATEMRGVLRECLAAAKR